MMILRDKWFLKGILISSEIPSINDMIDKILNFSIK